MGKTYKVWGQDGNLAAYGVLSECAEQLGYSGAYMAILRSNCNTGRDRRYRFEVVEDRPIHSSLECPCKTCAKGPEIWPAGRVSRACPEYCSDWTNWMKRYWRALHEKYGKV